MSDFLSAALHHCSRAAGWHLRLCWQVLRWLLVILALLWALAVVAWVVLHWAILPHANEWRPALARPVSRLARSKSFENVVGEQTQLARHSPLEQRQGISDKLFLLRSSSLLAIAVSPRLREGLD